MIRKKRLCILLMILLAAAGAACASDGWTEEVPLRSGWDHVPYLFSDPFFFSYSDYEWTMRSRYVRADGTANAMLLETQLRDENGLPLTATQITQAIGTVQNLHFCVPYPQGHDGAMGYAYTITCVPTGRTIERDEHVPYEKGISFSADEVSPAGPYLIAWNDTPAPRPVAWDMLMARMDWTADSCSYTAGTGSTQVSVSRTGSHTRISGGVIRGLSFRNHSVWGDDWQADFGWHTEAGTYTFSDVALDTDGYGDVDVWAHEEETYRIVFEESVRGVRFTDQNACEVTDGGFGVYLSLRNAANVELVNHTTLRGTYGASLAVSMSRDCAFTLSGTGKVYPPEEVTVRDAEYTRPVPMSIHYDSMADTDAAAVADFLGMLDRTQIEAGQFAWAFGQEQLSISFSRSLESFLGVDMDLHTAEVLTDPGDLGTGAEEMQIVVSFPDQSAEEMLTRIYPQEGSMLCFGDLRDADGQSWWLLDEADVYIPYPDGITAETADQYIFTAEYPSVFGEGSVLTTGAGITSTPFGLKITVEELLPFSLRPRAVLRLPQGLRILERSAFEGCGRLDAVVIPESVTQIGEDAFSGCPGALLIVSPGSYAQTYAEENGLPFSCEE